MLFYYDIETFPNFFSALFISEDFRDEYLFLKFGDINDIPALIQFIQQPGLTLVGFNSVFYDDVMLKALMARPEMTNRQLFNVSSRIINTRKISKLEPKTLRQVAYDPTPWRQADMMNVLKINTNRPSLKFCAVHLKHDTVQDLPKPFDSKVLPPEVTKIVNYNRNDVVITGKIYQLPKVQEAMILREQMGFDYGVDLYSADDSKIGNVILESEYGVPKVRGTRRKVIEGIDLIPPTLEFKTPEMQAVLEEVVNLKLIEMQTESGKYIHLIRQKNHDDGSSAWKTFEIIFSFDGTTYKMAKGGLHSEDEPRLLKPRKGWKLRDADVGSYYPSLGQRYRIAPAHLDKDRFLAVVARIIERRLEAKHSGDKVTADGLKICINGVFGKFNYEGFWLYDPLCLYKTTLYGQLLLLMLIEMLYLKGIHCVSANTDGIVCEIPDELEDVYFETCVEWQKITGMNLEYTDYLQLVQLNVNSYMSEKIREGIHDENWNVIWKEKSGIKTKKDFLDNLDLNKASFVKGFSAPIIALALQSYFKDGITPEETITKEIDVHNFFFSPKGSRKFKFVYRTPSGEEINLQKTNRFYITTKVEGVIVKKDKTDYEIEDDKFNLDYLDGETSKVSRETSIWRGEYVHIMNDIHDDRPPIKYQFYIDKVQAIIDDIEGNNKEEERPSILDFL